jgi:integrase
MPRPRRSGAPARPTNKRKLSDRFVRAVVPDLSRVVVVWDARQPGLCLAVHPTGKRMWRTVYRLAARPVWLTIGDARSITLADARKLAARISLEVALGKDPAAERRAERAADTFGALAARYFEEWARRRNKSWKQSAAIAERHLLPRWRNLKARAITRADVRGAIGAIASPFAANAALATASAIFSFGVRMEVVPLNPCSGIARNPERSRERVLSDAELRLLWGDLDAALKLVLLTGQRPGEVFAMRRADIIDGVWHLPGAPAEGGWPGTKSGKSHAIPLSEPAAALIDEHLADRSRRRSEERLKKLWMRHGLPKVRPHDLRRSFATIVARLGYGRQAVSRLLNHSDNSITAIYDRHQYIREDKAIVDAVARHVTAVVEGRVADNIVRLR